ncbi:hypothetical protein GCM10020295_65230 [Streptomyces cinereospinus]
MYDPGARRVGEFQAMAGPYAMLRPVGGGREWEADPARIRPATDPGSSGFVLGVAAASGSALR